MSAIETLREEAAKPLEEAKSLSFTAYSDQDVFDLEVQKIFHNEWIFVCQVPEVAKPGDYCALRIAGEPVYVMRGNDGQLRAFSNICRHRGTQLLDEGFGTVEKYVTCPYHAWAFDLQGELKAVPFNKLIAVDRDEHKLNSFHVDVWHGLVFVHLGESPMPLFERFSGIDEYIKQFSVETFVEASSGEVEIWDANWKLAMENAMESYHLFKVHQPTLEQVSPTRGAYYMAGNSEWSLTGGALTAFGDGVMSKIVDMFSSEIDKYYILLSLAPSFVGVLNRGSLGWIQVLPISPTQSEIRSGFIGVKGSVKANEAGGDFTRAFFEEDKQICERVQKGMSSVKGRGGKLVDMERVVTDFHQFLASRLFDMPPSEFFEEQLEDPTG